MLPKIVIWPMAEIRYECECLLLSNYLLMKLCDSQP